MQVRKLWLTITTCWVGFGMIPLDVAHEHYFFSFRFYIWLSIKYACIFHPSSGKWHLLDRRYSGTENSSARWSRKSRNGKWDAGRRFDTVLPIFSWKRRCTGTSKIGFLAKMGIHCSWVICLIKSYRTRLQKAAGSTGYWKLDDWLKGIRKRTSYLDKGVCWLLASFCFTTRSRTIWVFSPPIFPQLLYVGYTLHAFYICVSFESTCSAGNYMTLI